MKATAIWTAAYHINRVHGWLRRCGISRCMADEIGRDLHDKHILSPAQLRQIKDFWRPYWKVNPLFFKFYAAAPSATTSTPTEIPSVPTMR